MAMIMLKKKRGIFFTLISMILVMVMIAIFKPDTNIISNEIDFTKDRINNINSFINDIERVYLPAILKSSTLRALTSLTYYIESEDYLTDLNSDFEEVMLYGTVDGTEIDNFYPEELMKNNTLYNWTDKISDVAKDTLNLDITFTDARLEISQESPWYIDVKLVTSYSVSSESASWSRDDIHVSTNLKTENFLDPIYYKESLGAYEKKVVKSDIIFNQWDDAKMYDFISNETYFHWQNSPAPSFLMRFTYNMTGSSCCGIESAVNPNKISPSYQAQSYLDYVFWNSSFTDCNDLYNLTYPEILSDYPGFKLDTNNLLKYNIVSSDGTC